MRLLLIDDDPEVRFLAGYVLQAAGFEVTAADCGVEGIRIGLAEAFDAVLLDLHLGDMGGVAVLAALVARWPAMPVVFLTAADDEEIARALMAAGAAGLIVKPFDPEALAGRVCAIVAARHSGE